MKDEFSVFRNERYTEIRMSHVTSGDQPHGPLGTHVKIRNASLCAWAVVGESVPRLIGVRTAVQVLLAACLRGPRVETRLRMFRRVRALPPAKDTYPVSHFPLRSRLSFVFVLFTWRCFRAGGLEF